LLTLLLSGPALAQEAPPCDAKDPTTAEVNSREGVRLAKEGRFEEAAALFRIAVRLDGCAPDHQLLLARSLARHGDREGAMHGYATVVEGFPGTPEAKRARAELTELEATPEPKPEAKPTPEPAPVAETVAPRPDGPPWDAIGYATAGAGVLLLGAGAFFALDAQEAEDALVAGPDTRSRYDELADQRDGSTTLAYTFYGLGAVAVAGGAVMAFVLDEPPSTPPTDSLSLVPTADGAALVLRTPF